jgi:hypothetical protein
MIITHKTFLCWLIYAVCVVFVAAGLSAFGVPQMALAYDYSQLTLLLFLMYGLAESSGRRAGVGGVAAAQAGAGIASALRARSHGFSKMKRLSDGRRLAAVAATKPRSVSATLDLYRIPVRPRRQGREQRGRRRSEDPARQFRREDVPQERHRRLRRLADRLGRDLSPPSSV